MYAFIFGNPANKEISIKALADKKNFTGKIKKVTMLDSGRSVKWKTTDHGLSVNIPENLTQKDCNVIKIQIAGSLFRV